MTSPLDEPHSLWTLVHIAAPFVLVYEIGDPRIVLALIFLWEVVEWLNITLSGDYGPFFWNTPTVETLWDVWVLDISGGIFGILIAMSFHYFEAEKIGGFWTPFIPVPKGKPWVRLIRFLVFAGISMVAASFGWDCIEFFPSICVDGYHYLPWGAFVMLPVFALYIWWINLPKLSYGLLVLFIPVFIPVTKKSQPVSASFIQFIMIATISTIVFVGCLVDRWRDTQAYTSIQ